MTCTPENSPGPLFAAVAAAEDSRAPAQSPTGGGVDSVDRLGHPSVSPTGFLVFSNAVHSCYVAGAMFPKYDSCQPGMLDARVWPLIVGHGEIFIEALEAAL